MIQFKNAIKKFNNLILSELNEVGIKCWIAGGSLRNYFSGNPMTTDYDLFFPNEVEFNKTYDYFKNKGCEIKWESNNGVKILYNDKIFDLVKKFFPSPKDTIDAFDFTVSMFAIDCNEVYHHENSFIDLAKKQLMFNKITYPESTFKRTLRYYKKGFLMCDGEVIKLIEAIKLAPKLVNSVDNGDNNDVTSGDIFTYLNPID